MSVVADDDNDGQKSLLSLIENSVHRIPLNREEFGAKLGISFSSANNGDDASVFFEFRGNLSRICCLKSTKKKSSIRSSIRNWLDKLGKKSATASGPTNNSSSSSSLSRTLGSSRTNTTTCPRALFELYVERARADMKIPDDLIINENLTTDDDNGENRGGNLVLENRSSNSLAFYCNGVLFDGEIHDDATKSASNIDTEKACILQCAAYLYYQLWWFRVAQGRDVSRAYGFAISLAFSSSRQPEFVISLLILEKPTTGPIAGRYKLYEYTRKHRLLNDNNDDKNVLVDLGRFVCSDAFFFSSPRKFPNPFDMVSLKDPSPGCAMLLPSSNIENYPGCEVIPTLNGSLVICTSTSEVQTGNLTRLRDTQTGEQEDEEAVHSWLDQLATIITSSSFDDSGVEWYIKYKTPASFGKFFDTAEVAINGTRRILQTQLTKKNMTTDQKIVALEWLLMHPVDAFVSKCRSISMVRGMGTKFVGHAQLSWIRFKREFLSLMRRVLIFQGICNIVHGDIYEANVLFDDNADDGSKLVLIDWDEALRNQPCYRKTTTDEERMRYPSGLVNFPDQYTKHQFLYLFQHCMQNLYHDEEVVDDSEVKLNFNLITLQEHGSRMVSSVDARFRALSRVLQL